jgi:hypothetical protein
MIREAHATPTLPQTLSSIPLFFLHLFVSFFFLINPTNLVVLPNPYLITYTSITLLIISQTLSHQTKHQPTFNIGFSFTQQF